MRAGRHAARWAPGDSEGDWTLDAQGMLFALLPTDEIGVRLSEHNVMVPAKSLSFVLLAGGGPAGVECLGTCGQVHVHRALRSADCRANMLASAEGAALRRHRQLGLPGGVAVRHCPGHLPPVRARGGAHVGQALDLAAAALAEGRPVPERAQALMARSLVPAWLYRWSGNRGWRQQARANGVEARLYDRPLETQRPAFRNRAMQREGAHAPRHAPGRVPGAGNRLPGYPVSRRKPITRAASLSAAMWDMRTSMTVINTPAASTAMPARKRATIAVPAGR